MSEFFKNFHCMILSGGQGTRLWPLSTEVRPKALLPFQGKGTLLEQTIARCRTLTDNVSVITCSEQVSLTREVVGPEVPIIAEPYPRNTAPAILLACFELHEKNPDAIAAFLPADSHIPDHVRFARYLARALEYAAHAPALCLFGIKPTFPATGYGYIEIEQSFDGGLVGVSKIIRFHEKPNRAQAEQYLADKNKLWNIGIFVGRVSTFIAEYQKHVPQLFDQVQKYFTTKNASDYAVAEKISIDYAVMERTKSGVVLPADLEWSDVGNLDVFLSLQQEKMSRQVVAIDAQNNLVAVEGKLVALIGVDDLCIVEHEGVLIIAKRSDVERVKEVAALHRTLKSSIMTF